MTSIDTKRTSRPIRRPLLALLVVLIFGMGLHLLAPAFNGLKFSGLPLGYEIAAQVGPLLLALLVIWLASGKVPS